MYISILLTCRIPLELLAPPELSFDTNLPLCHCNPFYLISYAIKRASQFSLRLLVDN